VTSHVDHAHQDALWPSPSTLRQNRLVLNAPYRQNWVIPWTGLCLFLFLKCLSIFLTFPVGSDPWQAGLLGMGMAVVFYLINVTILLWAQRSVEVTPGFITIRRWTDVFRGRDELTMPVDQLRVGIEGVAIEGSGGDRIMVFAIPGRIYRLWIYTWRQSEVQRLKDALVREGLTIGG
jgi:hypothetical protein